jgi:biopolymer transport protein ExbD
MNKSLPVCLLVLGLAEIVASYSTAQSPALQKGVSVQMAASSNAQPMPAADDQDAWIVAVTADGKIYFGVDQVTADGLTEQMKIRPRNRAARLYVKADANAPFSSVRQVLRAAHVDMFDDVVLLTSQPEAAQPKTIMPPKGLDVWIGTEPGSNPITVQIGSEQGPTTVKVNNESVAPSELQSRLGQIFDNRAGRIVVLKASGQVPYARVIDAIDACRAAGASRVAITVSSEV